MSDHPSVKVLLLTNEEVAAALEAVRLQIYGQSLVSKATNNPFAVDRVQFELLQSVRDKLLGVHAIQNRSSE